MKSQKMLMLVMLLVIISGGYFVHQGVSMHQRVPVEEARFHQLQDVYFNTPKAERDNAPRGSELNAQLVEIQQMPSALMELKLIGVGKILTGIFVLLFGILLALIVMPMRIRMVLRSLQGQ